MEGVNDSLLQAEALVRLVAGIACKINLIPLNRISVKSYKAAPQEAVNRFHAELLKRKLPVFTRCEKGADIDAACGQLGIRMGENKVNI